jgi:hypothetical protein
MDEDQLIALLKKNLSIRFNERSGWYGDRSVEVEIFYDQELLCESSFDLPSKSEY